MLHGNGKRYEFDDRVLAHLNVVVGSKLRRKEAFYLSWELPPEEGSGRTSLWVSPSTPLQFQFRRSQPSSLNRAWLEVMATSSHGPQGLVITSEEKATADAGKDVSLASRAG